MRKLRTIIMITLLLLSVLAAGCIGGDGDASDDDITDDEPEAYEGLLSSLKIPISELPEGYELMGEESVTDASEFDDDDQELIDLEFQEAYTVSYMYLSDDFSDMGLVMELVIKFSPDTVDEAMDTFNEHQIDEFDENATIEEIDGYGEKAYLVRAHEGETDLELYQIIFVKKDVMVAVVATGADDSETLAEDLAGYVDSLI